ncbi:MAG: efflux RND transporter periplasmic adaptor subunit [Betaproteobacteria bacterium]|nr:efflux RND transporter periplasmic adaptor subunit [Betaproteobacteria bacterium]
MKRLPLVLIVIGLTTLALGIGYWAGTSRPPGTASTATGAPQVGKAERKPLYYRNPMGLPDTSPVPKKDPMGMDYLPVYAGDAPDDAGVVSVSPQRIQTLGVKTAAAAMKELGAAVRAVGKVDVDERAIHDVAPRFDGWIDHLYVSATGDPVRKGQALFSVYSPEVASAYKELAIAKELEQTAAASDVEARRQAARLSAATTERLRNWNMAGGQGDAARVTYRAPVGGIVLEKKAVDGMRFQAGTPLYRIADLSTIWVLADVYEQDIGRIRVGQPARVTVDAFPGRTFDATVAFVYPTLDPATRTTPIRVALANPGGLLRPGMFAHVDVATGGSLQRLTVPASAVIDDGSRQIVLLDLGGGKFKPREVKLGLRGTDDVEVTDGLKEGERVASSATFLLDSESNLKSALSRFAGTSGHPVYRGRGTLDSIDVGAGTVTITHQAIPELQWPGMTMDFRLADAGLARGLAPHTPIRFELEARGQGDYVVTGIDRDGP